MSVDPVIQSKLAMKSRDYRRSKGTGALANETFQQLRKGGLSETEIMAFAGELLSLVATELRSQAAAE